MQHIRMIPCLLLALASPALADFVGPDRLSDALRGDYVPSAGSPRGGTPLVGQPNNGTDAFFSDGAAGQFYDQRMADSFTLDADAGIVGVQWWGVSEFFQNDDLSNVDSFVIDIYFDAGGTPGAATPGFPRTYLLGQTNLVASGRTVGGATEFEHKVLFDAVPLFAGTYWISIGAVLTNPAGDAWGWSDSASGNGELAFESPYADGYKLAQGDNYDLAFVILVPEPASVWLLIGAAAALLRRRTVRSLSA